METLLQGMRAVAEPTRLRLLALCAHAELTVTELTQILGQSQPRVSRHLKLLVDAGLLDRFREGTWAFYRMAENQACATLGRTVVDLIPDDDPALSLDLERLEAVKTSRAEQAADYFRLNAARWDQMRSLYVDESEIESAMLALLDPNDVGDLLDIGTGTGRMLVVYGESATRAVGIDQSREMLSVARVNLEKAGLRNCQVRLGDMYQLPIASESFDSVTIHQVLHYADAPADVIAEAARALRPGGRLVVADFAPHREESLREEHAHRRLGFSSDELANWLRRANLIPEDTTYLRGDPLTVGLWAARRPANDEEQPKRRVSA
ncbi:MAG: metalloregulator ArsR/SmtB family transcription factor [Alphaproteobacteria bacterium]|nr:metalloregulator ArsR/SmtB family transcription factor [Alphaproteobacteria bacterium]